MVRPIENGEGYECSRYTCQVQYRPMNGANYAITALHEIDDGAHFKVTEMPGETDNRFQVVYLNWTALEVKTGLMKEPTASSVLEMLREKLNQNG